jgi:hypothetical protein
LSQISGKKDEMSIRSHGGELFLLGFGGCFMSNLLAAMKASLASVSNVKLNLTGTVDGSPAKFFRQTSTHNGSRMRTREDQVGKPPLVFHPCTSRTPFVFLSGASGSVFYDLYYQRFLPLRDSRTLLYPRIPEAAGQDPV